MYCVKKFERVYLFLTALCLAELFGHFVASHGVYERYFFWKDEADTGMDFVNSLAETVDGKSYSSYHSVYPPLANAYFYIQQLSLPDEVRTAIPDTHEAVVDLRLTGSDLRLHQSVLLLLILHSIISVLFVFCVVVYKFRGCGAPAALSLGAAAVFSYGSLYAIERGNIVLLATGFLMVFLFGYDSDDRRIRFIAYSGLVVSACIKLYPALFALMLFDGRKQGKQLLIPLSGMAFSGAAVSALFTHPFGGIKAIPVFLKDLFCFNSGSCTDLYSRYGMRGIVEHILTELYKHLGIVVPEPGRIARLALIISVSALMFALYSHFSYGDERYQAAFDIALIAVLFQAQSSDYTLCLFIPVILMLILEDPHISFRSVTYFVILMILVLPYYTHITSDSINLVVHHVDIVQLTLLVSVGFEFISACLETYDHLPHDHNHRHFIPPRPAHLLN